MNARSTIYWTTTILIALETLVGGVTDVAHGREVLLVGEPVTHVVIGLGYPTYLLTIIGICKIAGAIALLVPRLPRLKEWAYAGIVFELTGAAASFVLHGHDLGNAIFPLFLAGLALASWASRPPSRSLEGRVVVRRRERAAPVTSDLSA